MASFRFCRIYQPSVHGTDCRLYIAEYRNTGGFDIIGSGRTKLETPEQFEAGLKILKELNIKALCYYRW